MTVKQCYPSPFGCRKAAYPPKELRVKHHVAMYITVTFFRQNGSVQHCCESLSTHGGLVQRKCGIFLVIVAQ